MLFRSEKGTPWRGRAKRARLCQCVIPECFCRGSSDLKNTRRKAGFLLPGYFKSRTLTRRFAPPSPASQERAEITKPCRRALPGISEGRGVGKDGYSTCRSRLAPEN